VTNPGNSPQPLPKRAPDARSRCIMSGFWGRWFAESVFYPRPFRNGKVIRPRANCYNLSYAYSTTGVNAVINIRRTGYFDPMIKDSSGGRMGGRKEGRKEEEEGEVFTLAPPQGGKITTCLPQKA